MVDDVFSWGYARGLKLVASSVLDPKTNQSIGASNGQCTDVQFDAVDIGVEVQQTDPYGWFFSNLNLANAGWGEHATGIVCGASCSGNVVVRGASFWGAFHQAVSWNGTTDTLTDNFFSISDSTVENCMLYRVHSFSCVACVRYKYIRHLVDGSGSVLCSSVLHVAIRRDAKLSRNGVPQW